MKLIYDAGTNGGTSGSLMDEYNLKTDLVTKDDLASLS